jgi:protein disulfide-isomerase
MKSALLVPALILAFAGAIAAEDTAKPDAPQIEALKLKDGREFVGIYDAGKGMLKLVDKRTGKPTGSMGLKEDQIAQRKPITIEAPPDKKAAAAALAGANGEWTADFKAALASAKATGRPILIDFTGSDWCGWCMKLHEQVFDTADFKAWASKSAVLMVADFPRRKELPAEVKAQNDELANKYPIEGYPTIVVIDANGKELGRSGYLDGGAKAWIQDITGKAHFPK